ncbi:hypothetical protein D9758_000920 [Tetrapyrgos nigripes]|uniref:Uncharacterized protein n=1 Tax=Tetrapyrgos nigripes TaxID=182062 RepID=A0A8H5LXH7_9AGAR|nr:hypothetical protein D9758_000920 [Tetrapyrgos nigripes]
MHIPPQTYSATPSVEDTEVLSSVYASGWFPIPGSLYILALFVIVLILSIVRYRYTCLTVSKLKSFVESLEGQLRCFNWMDELDGMQELKQLKDSLKGIKDKCNRIERQNNRNMFRWSSLHVHVYQTFKTLRAVMKCSDDAQDLQRRIENYSIDTRRENGRSSPTSSLTLTTATGTSGRARERGRRILVELDDE